MHGDSLARETDDKGEESIRFYFSSSIFEKAGSRLTIFLSEVRDIFIKVIGVLLFCNSNLLLISRNK